MNTDMLHDTMDEQAAKTRLAELGTARNTDAVAERAELLRVLGRLDEALAVAEESYRLAFFTGDRREVTAARLRRARVLKDQGGVERALTEVRACRLAARTEMWGELEAVALRQQASLLVDAGRFEEARVSLTELVELFVTQRAPQEQLTAVNGALEFVTRRLHSETA